MFHHPFCNFQMYLYDVIYQLVFILDLFSIVLFKVVYFGSILMSKDHYRKNPVSTIRKKTGTPNNTKKRQSLRLRQSDKKRVANPSQPPRIMADPLPNKIEAVEEDEKPKVSAVDNRTQLDEEGDHLSWIDPHTQEIGINADSKGTTAWGTIYEEEYDSSEQKIESSPPVMPSQNEKAPSPVEIKINQPTMYSSISHKPAEPEYPPQFTSDMRDALAWLQTVIDDPSLTTSPPAVPMEEWPGADDLFDRPPRESLDEIPAEASWINQFVADRCDFVKSEPKPISDKIILHEPTFPPSLEPAISSVDNNHSVDNNNEDWQGLRMVARNHYLEGNYAQSAALYRQLVTQYGVVCAETAIDDIGIMTHSITNIADFFYALAEAWTAMGDMEKAVDAYKKGATCSQKSSIG